MTIVRRLLDVTSADGARARVQLHLPEHARAALYWLPALGVGIGPNETLADALAERGIAVAVHEWRGLGGSDRRASRRCNWGYRELLELDVAAGLAAVREGVPGARWSLGGHSLGGQLALLHAALHEDPAPVVLVASGHPWWRAFPGLAAAGVRVFAAAIAPVTALCGHFPGTRLGFAGREASRLMREWAQSAASGDYRLGEYGDTLDRALAGFGGTVLAIRLADDRLAPRAALERLRALAPRASWDVRDYGAAEVAPRRPDHFGWLRAPAAIASSCAAKLTATPPAMSTPQPSATL